MATQLQIRRGTSSQVAAFTGAEGEIVVNTTNDSVHVNDGSTAGGFELARADLNNVSDTSLNAALTGNTVSALTITTLTLGSTAITATGAEINILDGVTATAAELNILDGVTSTTAELNILDGVTSTAAELNILDGVTATTAELNYVDGVTSAIQTQLDAKAPLASPTFTGNVGIGGASGGAILQLNNSSASYLDMKSDNVLRTRIYNDSSQTILESTTSNLIFKSNSTEHMRIIGGNVGIGTSSPSYNLHVTGSGDTIAAVTAGASSVAALNLGNDTNKADGGIRYDNSADALILRSGNAERMRITSAGNVGLGVSSPQRVLTLGKGDSSGVQTQYTNSTTGAGLGDGFTVGIDGSENAEFWNYSSTNMLFATNSTQRMILSSSGEFTLGNPSAGSALQLDVSATGSDGVDIKGTYYTGSYGPMKFHTGGTERMRIDSSGVILAGSTSKTFGGIDATRLAVVGGSNSSSNAVQMIVDEDGSVEGGSTLLAVGFSGDNSFSTANYINFFDSGGQQGRIEGTGAGAVSYQSGSDERLKSNIRDTASKWDALKQIRVRDFEWTADTSNKTVTGFIAQELHNIFPDAVSEGGDDVTKNPWTVDYGRTSPIVIKALQEAMDRIETLEAKVQTLENN